MELQPQQQSQEDAGEWQQSYDYSTGYYYYYNETLQITQWEPPPSFKSVCSNLRVKLLYHADTRCKFCHPLPRGAIVLAHPPVTFPPAAPVVASELRGALAGGCFNRAYATPNQIPSEWLSGASAAETQPSGASCQQQNLGKEQRPAEDRAAPVHIRFDPMDASDASEPSAAQHASEASAAAAKDSKVSKVSTAEPLAGRAESATTGLERLQIDHAGEAPCLSSTPSALEERPQEKSKRPRPPPRPETSGLHRISDVANAPAGCHCRFSDSSEEEEKAPLPEGVDDKGEEQGDDRGSRGAGASAGGREQQALEMGPAGAEAEAEAAIHVEVDTIDVEVDEREQKTVGDGSRESPPSGAGSCRLADRPEGGRPEGDPEVDSQG
eukprot:1187827-Prorocentrum_minimum.AAC.1